MTAEHKLEPIVLLLFVGMLFWTGMLFICQKFYPDDGQIFQVISGLLTGFSGAFFMRIKPRGAEPPPPDTTTTSVSVTTPPAKSPE